MTRLCVPLCLTDVDYSALQRIDAAVDDRLQCNESMPGRYDRINAAMWLRDMRPFPDDAEDEVVEGCRHHVQAHHGLPMAFRNRCIVRNAFAREAAVIEDCFRTSQSLFSRLKNQIPSSGKRWVETKYFAAPSSSIDVCPSCPQGCIRFAIVLRFGSRSSPSSQAHLCARKPMARPSGWPFTTPTTAGSTYAVTLIPPQFSLTSQSVERGQCESNNHKRRVGHGAVRPCRHCSKGFWQ